MKPSLLGLLRFWFWSDESTRPDDIWNERIGKLAMWAIPTLVIWAGVHTDSSFLVAFGVLVAAFARSAIIACNSFKLPGRAHSRSRKP